MKHVNFIFKSNIVVSLVILFLIPKDIYAQCPVADAADLLTASTFVIQTGDGCPTYTYTEANCCASTAATITVETGETLTIDMTNGGVFAPDGGGASITVESGGILEILNGSLGVRFGGTITIDAGAVVNVAGDFFTGSPGSGSAGNLILNGNLNVGGEFNLNGLGTVSGSGDIDATGGVVDVEGGTDTGWTGGCTGGCGALPVTLISFSGSINDFGQVELRWETASETNNEGFYVERSTGDHAFKQIGFVSGKGSTNAYQPYFYLDKSSFFQNAYYRLKQIDYDGKFEIFPAIAVELNPVGSNLNLYPNPVLDNFFFVDKKRGTLKIYNLAGELQKMVEIVNFGEEIDISSLTPGQYIIEYFDPATGISKQSKLSKLN